MTFLEKALGFNPKTMRLKTEAIAGATTFLTMSYILAVNPAVLSSTGMDKGALFTATAIAAAIATLLLAFMAKLPFAQAPSMGLNAFFAYTMCQAMGYSWEQSLAIMLVEGVVFIVITFFNIREMILESIPETLRYAISAGIGMFIAFIGLKKCRNNRCQGRNIRWFRSLHPTLPARYFCDTPQWNPDGAQCERLTVLEHYHNNYRGNTIRRYQCTR